jgi:hypothetical protein
MSSSSHGRSVYVIICTVTREHSNCHICHNTVLTTYTYITRLPHAYIIIIIIIITVTIVTVFIIVVIFGSPTGIVLVNIIYIYKLFQVISSPNKLPFIIIIIIIINIRFGVRIPEGTRNFYFLQPPQTASNFLGNHLFLTVLMWPGRDVDHWPSNSEVKKKWSCTSASPVSLRGVDWNTFTFLNSHHYHYVSVPSMEYVEILFN